MAKTLPKRQRKSGLPDTPRKRLSLPDPPRGRLRRYGSFVLLTLILLVHFGLRYSVNQCLPLESKHFYPDLYNIALSLTGETGLKTFALDGKIPAHAPVIRFLSLKQASLTTDEFSAFLASKPALGAVTVFARNRLFEFRVASWLWRIFGISWGVIAIFYIIVSTLCCLCIFFLCTHLTGNKWCGLLGAAFYAVLPCEMVHSVWSIRDANPTWFTILALTFCLCVAGRFQSQWVNACSYFLLGVLSLIGLGWRSDAILIPGLTLLGLLIVLRRQHRKWKHCISALTLFAVGIACVYTSLLAQITTKEEFSPAWITHIAVYADNPRANIGGYENSYQMFFDDGTVISNVYRWVNKTVPYLGTEYARACTQMLWHEASYNMFNWIDGFPLLWGQKIWEGCGDSYGSFQLRFEAEPVRDGFELIRAFMKRYWIVLILAFAGAFLFSPHPPEALLLAFFSVYYTALYWVMLPMEKHITPMSLPAAVAFAFASCAVITPLTAAGRSTAVQSMQRRWKSGLTLLILTLTLFLISREVARWHSTSVRASYVSLIRDRSSKGLTADDNIKSPQKAILSFPPGTLEKDRGYCWKIHAYGQGGILALWMRRPTFSGVSFFPIPAGQDEVFFYSTCTQYLVHPVVDAPLDVVVVLQPGMKFESCRSFDLDGWKTLPFSTVFYPGQTAAGSPRIDINPPVSGIASPIGGWEKLLTWP